MLELMAWSLVVLLALGLVGASIWSLRLLAAKQADRRALEERWHELGGRLGLEYIGPRATLTGLVERVYRGNVQGRELRLLVLERTVSQDWKLRARLLRQGLPEELALSSEGLRHLGVERLRLRPGGHGVRDLALARVPSHAGPFLGAVLRVDHPFLHLELSSVPFRDPERAFEAVLGLVAGLEAASDQAWLQAARRMELRVGPSREGEPPPLEGQVQGVAVSARVRLNPTRTEVVARWRNRRIADLEVALPEVLPEQPKLEVPVLDMLVAVRCQDRVAARELLGEPETTEALLEVVHGLPGSRVTPGQVRLVREGEPGEAAAELIRKAARLASLLDA